MAKVFIAVVRNGRLIADEPTDLPEGSVVTLAIVEADDSVEDDTLESAYAEESISQVTSRTALQQKLRK
jgi:hypothetical protein